MHIRYIVALVYINWEIINNWYYITGAQVASISEINDDFPVRLYDVNCTGSEGMILQCQSKLTLKGEGYSQCSSGIAGVFCQGNWCGTNHDQYCFLTIVHNNNNNEK